MEFFSVESLIPIFIVFLFLESIYNYKNGKMVRINDALSSLSSGMMSRIILKLIYSSIDESLYGFSLKLSSLNPLFIESGFISQILLLILIDLAYYSGHRFSHYNNIFWLAHSPHHSSEEYNLSTALRQGILENLFFWIFYLPILPFFSFEKFMFYKTINVTFQFFVHTETVGKFPPIVEYIFNTPSHHRVHHARNKNYIDKNFAGMFVIIDRFFGTFAEEIEKPVYGLVHPIQTFNPVFIQTEHLKSVFYTFISMPTIPTKIKSLLLGPGLYFNEKKKELEYHEIPDPYLKVPKFNPKTNTRMSFISLVQFFILVPIFMWFQENPIFNEIPSFVIFGSFLVVQLIYVTYLLELSFTDLMFYSFQAVNIVFLLLCFQINFTNKFVVFFAMFFPYPLFKYIRVERYMEKYFVSKK
eukprot:TRINITY_DN4933_c0_g1_i1.p1 TRINITY_DN4933_c0_g1~~TRINITY_DN4933_c0_g1_i1.p1  ORF type:complete len:414 (+),score=63.88 TRINITY_DN4933_c0_g1_i1:51-1292(+)